MRRTIYLAIIFTSAAILIRDGVCGRFSTFRRLFDADDLNELLKNRLEAWSWDADQVRALVRRGADVNLNCGGGITLLHKAACKGDRGTMLLAVSRGADVNARDSYGATPLHWAAMEGQCTTAVSLIDRQAEIDARDENGRTPLDWTIEYGRTQVALVLIGNGADVTLRDDLCGETVLHRVASIGDSDVARALLEKGASVNALDSFSATPLDRAMEPISGLDPTSERFCEWTTQREKIVALLRRYGGKPGKELR